MYEFKYHRPTTVRQAVNLLAKNPEAKILAGGHSLIPVMKLRLAKPSDLIDLSQVEGLAGVELKGRSIVVGAMTKHGEVANSRRSMKDNLPVLSEVAEVRSAIRRCATAAPSATRSPTTIRTRIIRLQCSRSARLSSPTSVASPPTSTSRGCSTPRSNRARSLSRCSSRSPRRRLREVQASGLGLCPGRRVRVEAWLRYPRCR